MLIFLYGPPGVGKSAAGKRLAQDLALPFYDLDVEIETRSGLAVIEIFAVEGEAGFRRRECTMLEWLCRQPDGVVALGGGALLDPLCRALAQAAGHVVVLQAPQDMLRTRLAKDAAVRPLVGQEPSRLVELLARRAGHYASFPLQLDTGGLTPEQVAWEVQVRLGVFHLSGMGQAYDVRVQPGGLGALGAALLVRGLGNPVVVVSDEQVAPLYAEQVLASLTSAGYPARLVVFPAGEQHKTLATVSTLWETFLAAGVERGSTILALGGGVVGDLAGFASAVFLRGVSWVYAPTTLLAMADASLGGKTGADLPQGKNLIGAFHPPRLVLADPRTLATLPAVEYRSGMAEALKHGVIGDPRLFALCQADEDRDELVRRSMAVKVRIVAEDPYERGRRAALNLGHTVGHAVELVSGYRLRHGEAVAIGMVAEARLAERLGLAADGLAETIAGALRNIGLPVEIPPGLERAALRRAMRVDKKCAGGKLRFALPIRVGEVRTGVEVDEHLLEFL